MGKYASNNVLDAPLDHITSNVTAMVLCEGEPADYSDTQTAPGSGGVDLAQTSMSSSEFTGPSDDAQGGRSLKVDAQTGISVDNSGEWDHLALVDGGAGNLVWAEPLKESKSLTAGDTQDTFQWSIRIGDPR